MPIWIFAYLFVFIKQALYFFDLLLNFSSVEQILRNLKATPFCIPKIEGNWWQESACKYRWLSVGLL